MDSICPLSASSSIWSAKSCFARHVYCFLQRQNKSFRIEFKVYHIQFAFNHSSKHGRPCERLFSNPWWILLFSHRMEQATTHHRHSHCSWTSSRKGHFVNTGKKNVLAIHCFKYNGHVTCSDSHYWFCSSPLRIIHLEQSSVTLAVLQSQGETLGNGVALHRCTLYSISSSKDKTHQY